MHYRVLLTAALLAGAAPAAATAQLLEVYAPSTPLNLAIPDGSAVGVVSTINIPFSSITDIREVSVTLQISGGYNGDYYAYLVHYLPNGTAAGFVTLLNRSGVTGSDPIGYADAGFDITFRDSAAADVHNYQALVNPGGSALTGTWQPDGRTANPLTVTDLSPRLSSLAAFNGQISAGTWSLFVADLAPVDNGTFVTWGLTIQGVPEPGTWLTGTLALGALALWRRRRRG